MFMPLYVKPKICGQPQFILLSYQFTPDVIKEARMISDRRIEGLIASDHFGIHTTEPAAAGGRT